MNDLDVCVCRHFRIDHTTTLAPDIYLSLKNANVGDSLRLPSYFWTSNRLYFTFRWYLEPFMKRKKEDCLLKHYLTTRGLL